MPATTVTADKTAEWAAAAIEGWHGPNRKGLQAYAEAFHAAWTNQPDAAALLAVGGVGPQCAGVRARGRADASSVEAFAVEHRPGAQRGSRTPIRWCGSAPSTCSKVLPPAQLWPLVSPLLADPSRGVRIRAVALRGCRSGRAPAGGRPRALRARSGRVRRRPAPQCRPARKRARRSAISWRDAGAPPRPKRNTRRRCGSARQYAPAAINLADLYRQLGRDADGEAVLRATIAASPQDAGPHHALGLTLIRLKRPDEALGEFAARASSSRIVRDMSTSTPSRCIRPGAAPMRSRFSRDNLARHPDDRDILSALVNFSREAGDAVAALDYAERLARLVPGEPGLAALIETLRRQAKKPGEP